MKAETTQRILLLITARTYRAKAFKEAADRLGVEVFAAVDMKQELAQYWNYPLGVDFSNPESAVAAVVDFARSKAIGAVLSVDDSGTKLAAQVSKQLGLRHNSPEAAEASGDKHLMRARLTKGSVKSPDYSLHYLPIGVGSGDESAAQMAETLKYPVVVKPVNLNGSRGVIRANTPREFEEAVNQLSNIMSTISGVNTRIPYLVERYIDGIEVAVEGLLDDGKLQVLAIFDKPDLLEGPYFEETIYITPSILSDEIQEMVGEAAAAAASAIGLRHGPIHAECRINDDGIWIIEIAGRSIGGLCSETLQFGLDGSLEELIIQQALNMKIKPSMQTNVASGVMMIPIPEGGILRSVSGISKAENVPNITKVEITARLNYSLVPLPEGDSYLGFIFARAEKSNVVESALRAAHTELDFEILPELNISSEHKFFEIQGPAS